MSKAFADSGILFKDEKDRPKVARFTEVKDFGPSMTSQAMGEEVDINKIVARIQKGQTVLTAAGEPFYGDVSEFGGLQDAIIKVQDAEDLFNQFPADIRTRFENDPVKMIEFLEDPKNLDEAIKMGFVKPKPEPEKPPVPEPGASKKPPEGGKMSPEGDKKPA